MFEVKPGWTKSKRTSLEGDWPEFLYVNGEFNVTADHRGVRMYGRGLVLNTAESMENFAWVIGDAATEYAKFKRGRIQTVGDNEVREFGK